MKNWGTDVIPKTDWIDPEKKYTCNGMPVINLQVKLYNCEGSEVTYPVKGTVILREKPRQMTYMNWSLDGRRNVVFQEHHLDLKEVKE